MDKAAIKTFAINSRRKLMEDVEYRMSLVGVTRDGIQDSITDAEGIQTFNIGGATHSIYDEDIKKRENLIKEVNNKGFENVVEEVAYTWFNRIIAIRYMEVNDYLPTRTRVLSSETPGKTEPDIITEAFNLDLDYTDEDKQHIFKLKDENKLDELFRFLFIKQCNKLNEILPGLFEKTEDYMELLINISFVSEEGIVRSLVDSIPEKDFTNQVEIIGWLYQFYNSELKKDSDKRLKKIPKERIPSVTQLFTPDWVVKYMVENSLGKLWLESHEINDLITNWKYFVSDSDQSPDVNEELNKIKKHYEGLSVRDIKIIDPCMGSGHILVYLFDVLMQIYVSEGYTEKDAAVSILENNLYGLDIDDRAYQLAYFAVIMKARSFNRKIFGSANPLLTSIIESNSISNEFINFIIQKCPEIEDDIIYLIRLFNDAKEYGSILQIKELDFYKIKTSFYNLEKAKFNQLLFYNDDWDLFKKIIFQAELLSFKYDIVITNPPYLGNNRFNKKLNDFIKLNYPLCKTDLYSVFLYKGLSMVKNGGFNVMVTMQSWMFNSKFKKFRQDLLDKSFIRCLLHMDNGVMGISFGTSATVFRKYNLPDFKGTYNEIKYENINKFTNTPSEFPIESNKNNIISIEEFKVIPDKPIAYWLNNRYLNIFKYEKSLSTFAEPKQGLATSDNDKFLRFWYEVDINKISFNSKFRKDAEKSRRKWFLCTKGGSFRKWYGNNEYIVNWENDGFEIKNFRDTNGKLKSRPQNQGYYFKEGITWSTLTSGKPSFRYCPVGFIPETKGSICYPIDLEHKYYILALLNSNIGLEFLNVLSPTFDLHEGPLGKVPFILDNNHIDNINKLVQQAINISKCDWDNYETSWGFKKHPFISNENNSLKEIYERWCKLKYNNFNLLKDTEIQLDKLFADIYNVENNFSVEDKFVSVNKANYEKDIRSFISFAVGCMFGRYSLDEEGLIFAGGKFDLNKYSKFIPDDDNIIPILDTEYFEDDIVGRFIEFVKTCFGEEKLEDNLDFIANALSNKKQSSREIIREYFLKQFFNDHVASYSLPRNKSAIYWQFDSGKQNGFKCLIYMHRYDSSLVARVRTDYLHKTQKAIEQNIIRCDYIINNTSSASEKSKVTKEKNKLVKQLAETREYDEALAYMANQNIEIDLDDGVKVNYAKFQNVEVRKEGQKAKKINLLKKI